jgi:hypothetical protein
MAGTPSDNPEEAHTDLMALIKAGRDLPPDMDKALAESFMEKHKLASQGGQSPTAQQAVIPQQNGQYPQPFGRFTPAFGMIVIVAVVAAIIVSQAWWALWFVFPLMGMFGGWRRYGRYHDERHLAREQWRHERYMARMGYTPQQPQQLPESTSKWEPPTVPTQRPTPPSASSAPVTGNDAPPVNPAG